MLRTALKLGAVSAALLVAMPGTAAVQLTGPSVPSMGIQIGLPTALAAIETDGIYIDSEAGREPGLLPGLPIVSLYREPAISGGPGEPSFPAPVTAIMPEPMTWAMMLVGLGVVGWSLRDRGPNSSRHISFS